jgi:hypothetical protein
MSALRVGMCLVLLDFGEISRVVPWRLTIQFGRRLAVNCWPVGKRSPPGTKKGSPPVMGIHFH